MTKNESKNSGMMDEEVREQILAIRDSGVINMLDYKGVQRIAFEREFYELVCFIEEHRKDYVHFIFYGNKE